MTRFMLDALNIDGFPSPIPPTTMLASYVDHPEYKIQPFTLLQERYPNHRLVSIAAHSGNAQVCDVENGAMAPADVPRWVSLQRLSRSAPWCYATKSNWALVVAACNGARVAPPLWWKADWADGPEIPAGAIGTQYAHNGRWDTSVLLDYIPGFDSPPAPAGGGTIITELTDENEDDVYAFYASDGNGRTYVVKHDLSGKLHLPDPASDEAIKQLTQVMPTFNTAPPGATGPGRGFITVVWPPSLLAAIPDVS